MVELLQVHSGDARTSSVHQGGDLTFSLLPVNNISKDVSSKDYSDWQLTCRSCPSAPVLNNLITKEPGVKTHILYVRWESERTVMSPSSGSNPRPKDLMLIRLRHFLKMTYIWPLYDLLDRRQKCLQCETPSFNAAGTGIATERLSCPQQQQYVILPLCAGREDLSLECQDTVHTGHFNHSVRDI